MTATSRPSRLAEVRRGAWRWLAPAALLVLAPKCVLCLLAYAGVGAALRFGGPEICGAGNPVPLSTAGWLIVCGFGLIYYGVRRFVQISRER